MTFWPRTTTDSGINRIRLEFKVNGRYIRGFITPSINRIRLEFKGHQDEATHDDASGINRIRLEFKV